MKNNSTKNDHFLRQEKKVLENFRKKEKPHIIEDASDLFVHFDELYDGLMKRQKRTNVLIVGITGVGKSSLINSIFGKKLALTGTGVPITQHFTKYSADNFTINIYDSKGLEHGSSKEFMRSTERFLNDHRVGEHGESENAIHVIWYVINSACGRWESFEEKLCKTLFTNIPIIFVLNKADITSQDERDSLRDCLLDMNLENCVGIFDVISLEKMIKCINECSNCGSDDIIIRKRMIQAECQNCDHKECLRLDNGRNDLVHATYDILPSFVKNAFTIAQTVSFSLKERNSLAIIKDFWSKWAHLYTARSFLKTIAQMMATLSINWGLKHSTDYAKFVSGDLVSVFTFGDKIKLLFHTNMFKQKVHFTSLGILWNRCLRHLTRSLFDEWTKTEDQSMGLQICSHSVKTVFSEFNDKNLEEIEKELKKKTIDDFLFDEITTEC